MSASLGSNATSCDWVHVRNAQCDHPEKEWVCQVVKLGNPDPLSCISELLGGDPKQIAASHGQ